MTFGVRAMCIGFFLLLHSPTSDAKRSPVLEIDVEHGLEGTIEEFLQRNTSYFMRKYASLYFRASLGYLVSFLDFPPLHPKELRALRRLCQIHQMKSCKEEYLHEPCKSKHLSCKMVGDDSYLTQLRLTGSKKVAPMSRALLEFRHLESLDAGKVFSGPIPKWIGQMSPHLTSLTLNQNFLTGPIPSALANLKNLERFEAFEQCSFPKKLRNNPYDRGRPCRRMFRIKWDGYDPTNINDWSCGGLSGRIPDSIQTMSKLRRFWVDENRLSGPLPPWFAKMPNLEALDLFANPLSGTIPKEWQKEGAFPKLHTLKIGGTNIQTSVASLMKLFRYSKKLCKVNIRDIQIQPSTKLLQKKYFKLGFSPTHHPLIILREFFPNSTLRNQRCKDLVDND